MQNQNSNESTVDTCIAMVIGLVVVGFLLYGLGSWLYSTWQFFTEPGLLARASEMVEALGLCCLAGILFLVVTGIYFKFFPPKEEPIDYY